MPYVHNLEKRNSVCSVVDLSNIEVKSLFVIFFLNYQMLLTPFLFLFFGCYTFFCLFMDYIYKEKKKKTRIMFAL